MMNIRKEREFAREFYCSRNISLEFHYIDIDELRTKLNSTFEKPDRNEMDIWLQS